jgi:hypothetical protein
MMCIFWGVGVWGFVCLFVCGDGEERKGREEKSQRAGGEGFRFDFFIFCLCVCMYVSCVLFFI